MDAKICTMDGVVICKDMQGCNVSDEAITAAREYADFYECPVHLVDDDGDWTVYPEVGGVRPERIAIR